MNARTTANEQIRSRSATSSPESIKKAKVNKSKPKVRDYRLPGAE